jgi:hypothetical protein
MPTHRFQFLPLVILNLFQGPSPAPDPPFGPEMEAGFRWHVGLGPLPPVTIRP